MSGEQEADGTTRRSLDDERYVIGAMMLDADVASKIIALLAGPAPDGEQDAGGQRFYQPVHRVIYDTIIEMRRAGKPHRELDIVAHLDGQALNRIGGANYLSTCTTACIAPEYAVDSARRVLTAAGLRDLAEAGVTAAQLAGTVALDEADKALQVARNRLAAVQLQGRPPALIAHDQAAEALVTYLEGQQARAGAGPTGALTGWPELDDLLMGLHGGQLIVVAGRPGLGKSTWARQASGSVAFVQRAPALFFSLEMSQIETALCLASCFAQIPLTALRSGTFDGDELHRFKRFLRETAGAPFYIDDTPAVTVSYIENGIRESIERLGPLGIVVVDQLTLIKSEGRFNSQEQELDATMRRLKELAKKYDVPIVVVHQLNRENEKRTDKRPVISDLRGSGSIEAHADIVILLHRDDYYDKECENAGIIEFDVAKHRGGPTARLDFASMLHLCSFKSMQV